DGWLVMSGDGRLKVDANLTITANCNVRLSDGRLQGTQNAGSNFTIAGQFQWSGGRIEELYDVAVVSMEISGTIGDERLVNSALNISGTATWKDNNDILMDRSEIHNYGTFTVENDRKIERALNATTPGYFDNGTQGQLVGTFTKTGAVPIEQTTIAVPFHSNGGNLNLNGFRIEFKFDVQQHGGTTTLGGGTITMSGETHTFTVDTGGVFSGPGVIEGSLVNNGQVDLGSTIGVLTIHGNYTQTSSAVLILK